MSAHPSDDTRASWEALPTEAVHPDTRKLDTMSMSAVLELMAVEDVRVVDAVRREAPRIKKAATTMASALLSGGRVVYIGAGTSGRLGVLEAAECPPTFGTDPDKIVAVMAGGDRSVFRSKEGAEDRAEQGVEALRSRNLERSDCVVGISASGVTPFVRGSLEYAREREAATVLVTCGPRVRRVADVSISPQVGPELLAGSTRMKAGTATKLVLNQMTLLAMIRLKKVFGPYMVDLKTTSRKLQDRAIRMVATMTDCDRAAASLLLQTAAGDVKTAVVMGRLGDTRPQAARRLKAADGDLRRVLEAKT